MDVQNLLQIFARDKVASVICVLIVLNVATTYFMPRLMSRPDPGTYVPPPTCYYDSNGYCVPCFGTTCYNEDCCRKKNHLCASAITGKLTECPDEMRRYWGAFEDEIWKFAREHPGAAALQVLAIVVQLIPLVVCCFIFKKNLNKVIEEQEKERKKKRKEKEEKEKEKAKKEKDRSETNEEDFGEIAEENEEVEVDTEHDVHQKRIAHRKKEKRRRNKASKSK